MATRLLDRIDRALAAAGGAAPRTRLLQGASGGPDDATRLFAQALDRAAPIERRAAAQWRHRRRRLRTEAAVTGSRR